MRRRRTAAPLRHLHLTGAGAPLVVAVEGDDLAWRLAPLIGEPGPCVASPCIRVRTDPELRPAAVQVDEPGPAPSRPPAAFHDLGDAVAEVWARIQHRVAERTAVPLLHGGMVTFPEGAIVVAGPSRSGKSTLVAHLADLPGSAYGSDEMVAIGAEGASGLPRPIHLRADHTVHLPDGWSTCTTQDHQLTRPPTRAATSRVGVVVAIERPGPTAGEVTTLTTAGTARLLLSNSFNLATQGWPAIEQTVAAAAGAIGVVARYTDAAAVVAELRALAAGPARASVAAPEAIAGRQGRWWRFDDSILVVAGDGRRVLSLTTGSDAPPTPSEAVRAAVDATLGETGW